jgi:hypothetical protein
VRRAAPHQKCPRCEADQVFPTRHEALEGNLIVVFIACTVCNWRNDIRISTEQIEKWIVDESILKRRAQTETARHMSPSASTRRLLLMVRANIAQARARDIPYDYQRPSVRRPA